MTNTTILAPAILRHIYRIEETQAAEARIESALLASGQRLVDVLAKEPVLVPGFEEIGR